MFKALILDSHNLMPKIVPQGIKIIEFLEGNGGVGSIKRTNFAEGAHLKYLKHRIDALDSDNVMCIYTLIEGDVVFDNIEFVTYKVRFEVSSDKGCVWKMTSDYYMKAVAEVKGEDIKQGKDKAMGLYKVVEEYLLANPNVYA